jgi:hypothetical protein
VAFADLVEMGDYYKALNSEGVWSGLFNALMLGGCKLASHLLGDTRTPSPAPTHPHSNSNSNIGFPA